MNEVRVEKVRQVYDAALLQVDRRDRQVDVGSIELNLRSHRPQQVQKENPAKGNQHEWTGANVLLQRESKNPATSATGDKPECGNEKPGRDGVEEPEQSKRKLSERQNPNADRYRRHQAFDEAGGLRFKTLKQPFSDGCGDDDQCDGYHGRNEGVAANETKERDAAKNCDPEAAEHPGIE